MGVRAGLSPISLLAWALSDIAFGSGGWHHVELTLNEIGCAASVVDSIFIELPPDLSAFDVEVWPAAGCVPLSVTLADAAPTGELDYGWSYGDGGSSLQDAPLHVYDLPGTYDVTVKCSLHRQLPSEHLVCGGGCRDRLSRS